MVMEGIPLFEVARILGHTTLSVTMRYAHFAPEAGRAAIDALDRALGRTDDGAGVVRESAPPLSRAKACRAA
jgi:hypothetical protein